MGQHDRTGARGGHESAIPSSNPSPGSINLLLERLDFPWAKPLEPSLEGEVLADGAAASGPVGHAPLPPVYLGEHPEAGFNRDGRDVDRVAVGIAPGDRAGGQDMDVPEPGDPGRPAELPPVVVRVRDGCGRDV